MNSDTTQAASMAKQSDRSAARWVPSPAHAGRPAIGDRSAAFSFEAAVVPHRAGYSVRASLALLSLFALLLLHGTANAAPLTLDPIVWYDRDAEPIAEPAERDPDIIWDSIRDSFIFPPRRFFDPVRFVRRVGTAGGGDHVRTAPNVNALDEVPNSTWFTNRIGLFPVSIEDAAAGPAGPGGAGTNGPDRSAPWTVVSAKTQGVTPGFNIRDARGDTYLIKFDPKGEIALSTCAGVVSGLLLHTAGYNVPMDAAVTFDRDDLVLGENVKIRLKDGSRRNMTVEDLDEILNSVDRLPGGQWFAISSKFLSGKPVGPFCTYGVRKDDPNDRIPHEDRRELRGLEVFAAWLNHYDTKQNNSLDMFIADGDQGYLRHYLIDFASTLGAGASGTRARYGYEYTVDVPAISGRFVSLGLHESTWRKLERPADIPSVGYFTSDLWDPLEFKSLQPHTGFANTTDNDGYWAAKIITAFTDAHIDAIVGRAGYPNENAAEVISRVLKERRDRIGRAYFDQIAPLDFFSAQGDRVAFRDLGAERGIYPMNIPVYRYRVAAVDADRKAFSWSEWVDTEETYADLSLPVLSQGLSASREEFPFVAVETQVRRYEGWSGSVTAYASRAEDRIVAVDR